jgi:hypothetical protein
MGKLSFHVATPLVLATADGVLLFSHWMRDTFENGDEPLTPLLDCGVYASCGNMRLPLNRKPAKPGSATDKPWLRPVSRVGDLEFAQTHDDATAGEPHGYTLDLLRQHAWTWVDPNYRCISDRLEAWGGDSGSPRKKPGAPQGSLATGMRSAGKRSATPVAAVPTAILDMVGRHLGVPAADVCVAGANGSPSTASSDSEARAIFTGRVTCVAHGTGASVGVFVSQRGNVYADTGDGSIATNLVERALSPARADSFSDWFSVGGALHSIDSVGLFDVWDRFSEKSAVNYPGRDKLLKRWGQFNGVHSLGTLVFMARADNAVETSAILRANRSFLGQLGYNEVEDTPAHAQAPTKRAKTLSDEQLRTLTGKTFDEFIEFTKALPGAGGGHPRVNDGDVSSELLWHTHERHTCCHGNAQEGGDFKTRLQGDGLVFRACFADTCKNAGHLDWRIIGAFGAGWTTEMWCSSEQPPESELRPWPLPRHWYFYEPLVQRRLAADVRCLAAKALPDFDPTLKDWHSAFHKFLVEYTGSGGTTVRAEISVCFDQCQLYHRTTSEVRFTNTMRWAYRMERDGDAVYDHARFDWWFRTTWKDAIEQHNVKLREGREDLWEPPHCWRIEGVSKWYPWLDLVALDAAHSIRHSERYGPAGV